MLKEGIASFNIKGKIQEIKIEFKVEPSFIGQMQSKHVLCKQFPVNALFNLSK